MAKVYEFLANGFEEIEGLAPVDILRRGGIDVTTVSITGSREVTTSHGVTILADTTFEDAGEMTDADLLMLPAACPALPISTPMRSAGAMRRQFDSGKLVAAICAAPMVLGTAGILQGKRATCSPGFQKYLTGAEYTGELFTVDGNVITGEGPCATLPYAYKILSLFIGEEKTRALETKMQYTHLMEK